MAVFTPVSHDQLEDWLARYDVGGLTEARGIAQGIENTNYFVETAKGSWVLTLIERIPVADVPFYLRLMKHLAVKGIPCPEPVTDRGGNLWSLLGGKPAALVSRLPGTQVAHPSAAQCATVGTLLARMHLAAQDFGAAPVNSRGLHWWPTALAALRDELGPEQVSLISDELKAQQAWSATTQYRNLPSSAVHADCFRDNVLMDPVCGPAVIDFYFACEEKWMFDLAVACNDWCVEESSGQLDATRTAALLDGYLEARPFQDGERAAWPMMLRAAALRFWLSRLYDHFLPRDAAVLSPKDPRWFERILNARRAGSTEIV
ncbi:MAG TPA: homoserine kinase [Lautropia sp.]|nr:homoserine kinase [Lautropia sp.]